MLMTPSKTMKTQDAAKLQIEPEWITVMGRSGADATSAREAATKTKAWWDLVADVIVGRR